MDFRQLEYIVAIAENKSISKAAETLFISQSGLNQQLIKLEKELGLQLFDRNKHFLRPTKAGGDLCQKCHRDSENQTKHLHGAWRSEKRGHR